MRIQLKVVPRAKKPAVEHLIDGTWRVAVTAPAEGGKANAAVIEALARHFDVPKAAVRIVRGLASRRKEAEVDCTRC